MATRLKDVDAVMVGMGWTGAIMARELTKAGLTVVGLERGQDRNPKEEFGLTTLRDELRYARRLELMQDNSIDTITFRNGGRDRAAYPPLRRVPAGRGRGRLGHPLGRAALALPADRFPHPQPARREVRDEIDPGRHDDP
jgi:gluconate 2-dehydrogenase alpha chain